MTLSESRYLCFGSPSLKGPKCHPSFSMCERSWGQRPWRRGWTSGASFSPWPLDWSPHLCSGRHILWLRCLGRLSPLHPPPVSPTQLDTGSIRLLIALLGSLWVPPEPLAFRVPHTPILVGVPTPAQCSHGQGGILLDPWEFLARCWPLPRVPCSSLTPLGFFQQRLRSASSWKLPLTVSYPECCSFSS